MERLRQSIREGQMRPGEMIGTELTLARQEKLGRNSVRRAVETLVDEGLLERRPGKGVYVRQPQRATRMIQVVVPSLAWPHNVQIAHGVQAAGRQRGVQVQIYDAHGKMELDIDVLRQLPHHGAEGAIIVSLHHPHFTEVLYQLHAANYPFVLADQRLQDIETVPSVEIDNYGGAYAVGKELLRLGHRRIGFMGPLKILAVHKRLEGLRDAMLDAGLLFDRSLVMDMEGEGLIEWMDHLGERVDHCVKSLMNRPDRPTVLFEGAGDAVVETYRSLRGMGLSAGRDVSVVTFEDSAAVELVEVPVASVKHPWTEMGHQALEMLLERINAVKLGSTRPAEHRVLAGKWIPRASLVEAALPAGA